MSEINKQAELFFEACETGKGWDVCSEYCHPNATFSAQADALSEVTSLEAYCEWTKGILTPIPDGNYELKCMAEDSERNCVVAFSVFKGTQTGPGGPGEPTGKSVATEYVYVMEFEGGKIKHMTKIWNDGYALKQLGWA